MPPFRNFLRPKPQPNGDPAILDENHLSPNQRPAPITIRSSQDEPTEYKLSGMFRIPRTSLTDVAVVSALASSLSSNANLSP